MNLPVFMIAHPYHLKAKCMKCEIWWRKPAFRCGDCGLPLRQWPQSKNKVLYKKLYAEDQAKLARKRETTKRWKFLNPKKAKASRKKTYEKKKNNPEIKALQSTEKFKTKNNIAVKKWRAKNKGKVSEYNKQNYQKRKIKLIEVIV